HGGGHKALRPMGWFIQVLFSFTCLAVFSHSAMDECTDDSSRPQRCMPEFVNAAFNVTVVATNTCGSPPEEYCVQTGVTGVTKSCHICDARDRRQHHSAVYLTDYNNQQDTTWWQSQTMLAGIQYPHSINLTLHLGKAFDITYVRLKFHTSRPESFAIYKRTSEDGPWTPYQYYSGSCEKTYQKTNRGFIRTGQDEQQALCTDEFSDISPLTGGNVAFSTLEGRPSAYNFDNSPVLQEWVTATDIKVTLNRLNTFGDEVFNDPKVLKSYYYAISDFAVGGRCKCNGHASECAKNNGFGKPVCNCKHNTEGDDCNVCKPFYNDRPWRRATANNPNECLPCNCNGKSAECYFDPELYRATGHGGHCRNCADYTGGPNCERCLDNYYRDTSGTRCLPCSCNPVGSLATQCDKTGRCSCKPGVMGDKCDRCQPGFHTLTEAGCRPCSCNPSGSTQECDVQTGRCQCKDNVEGFSCDRCKLGYFNMDPQNPQGCTPCFCFQHSSVCESAEGYSIDTVSSTFNRDDEQWTGQQRDSSSVSVQWSTGGEISLISDDYFPMYFVAPERFLGNQLLSYGQNLTLNFRVDRRDTRLSAEDVVLEGAGLRVAVPLIAQGNAYPGENMQTFVFRLHDSTDYPWRPTLTHSEFQKLLHNLTSIKIRGTYSERSAGYLDDVKLITAKKGPGSPARWVEKCTCPQGYVGQHCESCALRYRRSRPDLGPFSSCDSCSCNGHSDTCNPDTGMCDCLHNTAGLSCERCKDGYYGDSTVGSSSDCKPCPCPGGSTCAVVPKTKEVVCTNCPTGTTDGFFCDRCKEGFYGNPLCVCILAFHILHGFLLQTSCLQVTGQCQCFPHVTNRDCSACQPGFFNLRSGTGCEQCNCNSIGSTNGQCDIGSGQCECQPGVTGQRCERCEVNFFGFGLSGCKPCDCDPEGSSTAQCKEDGRCACLPGFVGARCDMCEENYFYNRSTPGCQQCPSCYSLVRDKVNQQRQKLHDLQTLIDNLGSTSETVSDKAFEDRLKEAEKSIMDLLDEAQTSKDVDKGLLERLGKLNSTLTTQWNRLQNIRNTVDNTGTQADKARNRVRDAENLIGLAREELDKAKDAITPSISGDPNNMTLLAEEARNLADKHKMDADQIEKIAKDANDTSTKALNLLTKTLDGEGKTNQDIDELNRKYDLAKNLEKQANKVHAEAEEAGDKALKIYANLTSLPPFNTKLLEDEASKIKKEASDLDKLIDKTEKEYNDLRDDLRGKETEVRKLLEKGKTEQQTADQLLARVDAAKALAEEAAKKGRTTYQEAQDILGNLRDFDKRVNDNKTAAEDAMKRIPEINATIIAANEKTKQAEGALGNAAADAKEAKSKAEEAEKIASAVQKGSAKTKADAEKAFEDTMMLDGEVNGMMDQLSAAEAELAKKKAEADQDMMMASMASDNAKEAEDNARKAKSAVRTVLNTINDLLKSLGNIDKVDLSKLGLIEGSLKQAKDKMANSDLDRKLAELNDVAKSQEEMITDYDRQIREIRSDIANLNDIKNTLPDGCFNTPSLERP
uniref:Laminin, gamma 1 n=1 Tax=Oncorhynchus mykiss TaxID=8022 RepID=A0A8C7W261_ONCMY